MVIIKISKEETDKFAQILNTFVSKENNESVKKYDKEILLFLSEIEKILEYDFPCDIDKLLSLDKKMYDEVYPIILGFKTNKIKVIDKIHKILYGNFITSVELNILLEFIFVRKMNWTQIKELNPLEFLSIMKHVLYFDNLFLKVSIYDLIRKEIQNGNIFFDDNGFVKLKWLINGKKYIFGDSDDYFYLEKGDDKIKLKLNDLVFPALDYDSLIVEFGSSIVDKSMILNELNLVRDELIKCKIIDENMPFHFHLSIGNILVSYLLLIIHRNLLSITFKLFEKLFNLNNIDDYTIQFLECLKEKNENYDEYIKKFLMK